MKTDNREYHPLPDGLYIGDSNLDGQGLFTNTNIPKNEVMGITHIEYSDGIFIDIPCNLVRTPLGGFINHYDNPNCVISKVPETNILVLITIKNLEPGDELVVDYNDNECGKFQIEGINCSKKNDGFDGLPF